MLRKFFSALKLMSSFYLSDNVTSDVMKGYKPLNDTILGSVCVGGVWGEWDSCCHLNPSVLEMYPRLISKSNWFLLLACLFSIYLESSGFDQKVFYSANGVTSSQNIQIYCPCDSLSLVAKEGGWGTGGLLLEIM